MDLSSKHQSPRPMEETKRLPGVRADKRVRRYGEISAANRNYLLLFDNTNKLEMLFGVKYPSLMMVVDNPDRIPILTTYCAQVLHDFKKTDWESRFLFSSLDTSLTPLVFFCAPRWLRSWLPIPPPVPYFTDQEDLLPSFS